MGMDWNGPNNGTSMSAGYVQDGFMRVTEGSGAPWADVSTGTSFTLSFDVSDVKANAWKTLMSLASSVSKLNQSDKRKLQVQANDSGELYIYNTDGKSDNDPGTFFDGSTANGEDKPSATAIALGFTKDDTTGSAYTLTFVSDATAETFTAYVNGEAVGLWTNWTPDGGVGGIQFGQLWGGGRSDAITDFKLDNVTMWNRALSATEVGSLIVPEPTTATLSLLALAGLAARRRRK